MNNVQRSLLIASVIFSFGSIAFAQTELPAPDDFIPVEVQPSVDLNQISKQVIYPDLAKRANIQGKVLVQVLIDETGKPVKSQIMQSADPLLDTAAMKAVMLGEYKPAIQKGKPIAVWIAIPISFKLRDSAPLFNTNTTTDPKKETPVPEPK